jgi:hypothetical protein
MRRTLRPALLSMGLLASMPAIASAQGNRQPCGAAVWHRLSGMSGLQLQSRRAGIRLPESDPNAAGAALTLLVGSVTVLVGKRRRPKT